MFSSCLICIGLFYDGCIIGWLGQGVMVCSWVSIVGILLGVCLLLISSQLKFVLVSSLVLQLLYSLSYRLICGWFVFKVFLKVLFMVFFLDKLVVDGVYVVVVDVEGIVFVCWDWVGEGVVEDNLFGFELDIVWCQFVGQSGYVVGWMIEYVCGDVGFFNYVVVIQQGGDLVQVEFVWFNWLVVEDYFGVGGVVGDGVEYFVWMLGFWVDVVVVCVDKFQCWDNVVGGVVDIKQCIVWVVQWFGQYEGQFDFNMWYDKVVGGNIVVVVKEYIVEQCVVVWFVDL